MRKTNLILVVILINTISLIAKQPIFDFKQPYLFPKISISKDFNYSNSNIIGIGFGEKGEIETYDYIRISDEDAPNNLSVFSNELSQINYDFNFLNFSYQLKGMKESKLFKNLNYSLIDLSLGHRNRINDSLSKMQICDYSFLLIKRNKDEFTGINEINHILLGLSANYLFYLDTNFSNISLYLKSNFGSSRFEMNNFNSDRIRYFNGFDWSISPGFDAKNNYLQIQLYSKVRNIIGNSQFWIYSFGGSLDCSYYSNLYFEGVNGLFKNCGLSFNFDRSIYKSGKYEKAINSFKLNIDLYLFGLLLPDYLERHSQNEYD